MIIRNPYGFLAKHYKIINILLLIPMIYIALAFGDIAGFFREYVSAGYSTPETSVAENYISILTVIVPLFMFMVHLVFYIAFTSKKKNAIVHLAGMLYYIILLVGLFLFYTSMGNIETQSLDATFANFVRDFATISCLPVYFFIAYTASKGIGFNFKTFRIDNNAELQLTEEDEEDIEIKVSSDQNVLKRNFVHIIRELKYYILENKFVFSCIMILFFGIIGYTTYSTFRIKNPSFTINQALTTDIFTLSVKESYLTNVDYRGTIIAQDKYYLAIKMGIENRSYYEAVIDRGDFRIYIGDDPIYPTFDKGPRFVDIGKPYRGEKIAPGKSDEYVFVYELTNKQLKTNYQMRILNELSEDNGNLKKTYKKINLRPNNVIKKVNASTSKLNQQVSFKESTLGDSKYSVKSLITLDTYQYTTKYCYEKSTIQNKKIVIEKVCNDVQDTIIPSGGKALVILEDSFTWDTNSSYYKNSELDFYSDFVTLEYKFLPNTSISSEEQTMRTVMVNVTPKILTDRKIYEVPSSILDASSINMKITVRNKVYTIEIK